MHYEKIYWDLVTASAIGKRPSASGPAVSFMSLIQQSGFTPEEMQKLTRAKINSDRLVEMEKRAFGVFEGSFPDESGGIDRDRFTRP